MDKSILFTILIISLALNGYWYFSNQNVLDNELKVGRSQGTSGFIMRNDLSCTVKQSSHKKNVDKVIPLLGLQEGNPRFLWKEGGSSPLTKFYEDGDILVVGLIASFSGGTDIFSLNTATGEFVRTTSGHLLGLYAEASKGICR